MIDNLSVIGGLACMTWAAWQLDPIAGWFVMGAALFANGIGGARRKVTEQKAVK